MPDFGPEGVIAEHFHICSGNWKSTIKGLFKIILTSEKNPLGLAILTTLKSA